MSFPDAALAHALAFILPSTAASPGHASISAATRSNIKNSTGTSQSDNFDIYSIPAAAGLTRLALRSVVAPLGSCSTTILWRQPLILYASPAQFQQTQRVGGNREDRGVTEALRRRIVLRSANR